MPLWERNLQSIRRGKDQVPLVNVLICVVIQSQVQLNRLNSVCVCVCECAHECVHVQLHAYIFVSQTYVCKHPNIT